jgi:hypothetical protein
MDESAEQLGKDLIPATRNYPSYSLEPSQNEELLRVAGLWLRC